MGKDEFVRVPRVATEAMLNAGGQEFAMTAQRVQTAERNAQDVYRAMLAAIEPESAQTEGECTCDGVIPHAFDCPRFRVCHECGGINYCHCGKNINQHTVCPQCGAGKEGV